MTHGNNIKHNNSGYTYIGVLFMVSLLGASLALVGTSWKTQRERDNEEELLFIGNQFIQAIGLYYERSPNGIKKYPSSLNDLLEDNRFPNTQRYLKRIYRDPITLESEWGLLQAPEGGIMGVYSLSQKKSLTKRAIFSLNQIDFVNANSVSDWHFSYRSVVQSYNQSVMPVQRLD